MSIKVYNAYHVNCKDPWTVIWDIRDTAIANAKAKLREYTLNIISQLDQYSEDSFAKIHNVSSDKRWRRYLKSDRDWHDKTVIAWHILSKNYKKQSPHDVFNFDACLIVCPKKNKLYFRTSCDVLMHNVFDFVESHPNVVDYHYQTQADKPEEISTVQWSARKRTWESLIEPNGTLRAAIVEICTTGIVWMYNPTLSEGWKTSVLNLSKQ